MSEDLIIAEGLIAVRDGILSGDWLKVCEGYNSISGEELVPYVEEKPKSRLDTIREKLGTAPKKGKGTKTKLKKGQVKGKSFAVVESANLPEITGDEEYDPVISKNKGGKRFAKDGFDVIQVPYNKAEAERNQKLANSRPKIDKRKPALPPVDSSKTEKDVRFYSGNTPPRREED